MSTQVTLWELEETHERDAWAAGPTKVYADLVAGDYVEVRMAGGHVWAGWCAARHPADGSWEIQADAATRHEQHFSSYFPLFARGQTWRFVRHDDAWTLGPSPEAVCAAMREKAATLPLERFHDLAHEALHRWPVGCPQAWTDRVHATFTALAITHYPVSVFLRHDRQTGGAHAGRRIWEYPVSIQERVTADLWPMAGADRLATALTWTWTRAEHFSDPHCKWPNGRMAFNAVKVSLYADYLRWAIAHADSPRQLLELLDKWGSNGVGSWLDDGEVTT